MVTNLDRAEWAAAALRHFQCITGTEYDDALTDLLCDLKHWSDREDIDFQSPTWNIPTTASQPSVPRTSPRR
jgi:hypothetical protein